MVKTATAAILGVVALATALSVPAFAQCNLSGSPVGSLRDPLIPGANSTYPMESAPQGQPPPVGSGSLPAPVTPGMGGGPTMLPSVPALPANNIEFPSYRVPYDPATLAAPGELGPSIAVPPPPSALGGDPGIIHAPLDYVPPPAQVVPVGPYGGIMGGAGNARWGGQQTHDFGRYKHRGTRSFDFGQEEWGNTSQDGPQQTIPGSSVVQDLYGSRAPWRNNGDPTIQTIAPY